MSAKDPRYIMLRPGGALRTGRAAGSQRRSARRVERGFGPHGRLQRRRPGIARSAWPLQAAKVIHNTWLYEQLRLKARLFESLASVSQTINSTLNLDDALHVITREACVLMHAQDVLAHDAG